MDQESYLIIASAGIATIIDAMDLELPLYRVVTKNISPEVAIAERIRGIDVDRLAPLLRVITLLTRNKDRFLRWWSLVTNTAYEGKRHREAVYGASVYWLISTMDQADQEELLELWERIKDLAVDNDKPGGTVVGSRGVIVGGDVRGATIITGDRF